MWTPFCALANVKTANSRIPKSYIHRFTVSTVSGFDWEVQAVYLHEILPVLLPPVLLCYNTIMCQSYLNKYRVVTKCGCDATPIIILVLAKEVLECWPLAPELKTLDTKTFLHLCWIVVDEQLAIWVLKLSNFSLVWSFGGRLWCLKDLFATSAGFCSNISLAEGRYSFQIVEMSLSICSGLLSRMRPLLPIPLAVDQVGPSHNS